MELAEVWEQYSITPYHSSVVEIMGSPGVFGDLMSKNRLYVVSRDSYPLYVGITKQHVASRFDQHLSGFWGAGHYQSPLGKAIIGNVPESCFWTVDMLSLAQCYHLAVEALHAKPDRGGAEQGKDVLWPYVEEAEMFLITRVGTCFNHQGNHYNAREVPQDILDNLLYTSGALARDFFVRVWCLCQESTYTVIPSKWMNEIDRELPERR